jgi:hypothetical protein
VSSLLDRLSPLTTTGVGSLPFSRPADAASHVMSAYELPFCPQLPRAYGDMVAEWLGADPGRCGWAPDRDRQLPAVWDPFILELSRKPPAHRLVKLQVTGPVTLAMALEPAARADALCGLAREISTWLAATVARQSADLAELGFDAILVIDEPGIAAAELHPRQTAVWDPLRATVPIWGFHVCGAVPWSLIDAAEPDLVSFDLARYGMSQAARRTLTRLISHGGRVMWGVFDVVAPQPVQAATRLIAAACASLSDGPTPSRVLAASLVSASCGTGLASIDTELALAANVCAAAALARAGSRDSAPVPLRTVIAARVAEPFDSVVDLLAVDREVLKVGRPGPPSAPAPSDSVERPHEGPPCDRHSWADV